MGVSVRATKAEMDTLGVSPVKYIKPSSSDGKLLDAALRDGKPINVEDLSPEALAIIESLVPTEKRIYGIGSGTLEPLRKGKK